MVKNPSKEHWEEWKERMKSLDIRTTRQKPIGTILSTTEKEQPQKTGHNIVRFKCKNCYHHKAVERYDGKYCTKCKNKITAV